MSNLSYPDYDMTAVNDGSLDETGEILVALVHDYKKLRVIECRENRGKANALHIGRMLLKLNFNHFKLMNYDQLRE